MAQASERPKHCGREMMAAKDGATGKPIWFCPDCHAKKPRKED